MVCKVQTMVLPGPDDNMWCIFKRFSSMFILEYSRDQVKWGQNRSKWHLAYPEFTDFESVITFRQISLSRKTAFLCKSTREALAKNWRHHAAWKKSAHFQQKFVSGICPGNIAEEDESDLLVNTSMTSESLRNTVHGHWRKMDFLNTHVE